MKWTVQHQNNITKYGKKCCSQGGQNGYIDWLLKTLEITEGWCLEAGSWDGRFLSNTYFLLRQGFKGIMIEGDDERYLSLEKNAANDPNMYPVKAFIDPTNINRYLEMIPKGDMLAVLSLDIDGGESPIWEAMERKFAICCIEWCDAGHRHPWTVLAAAERIGYRPVACTNSDIIFVLADLYPWLCEELAKDDVQ